MNPNPPFSSLTSSIIPDTSCKCSESQCPHLLCGAKISIAHRIFMRITQKHAWKILGTPHNTSTASVFSSQYSPHRDFVKINWGPQCLAHVGGYRSTGYFLLLKEAQGKTPGPQVSNVCVDIMCLHSLIYLYNFSTRRSQWFSLLICLSCGWWNRALRVWISVLAPQPAVDQRKPQSLSPASLSTVPAGQCPPGRSCSQWG